MSRSLILPTMLLTQCWFSTARISEELLRLRGCTEQLNGSLVIDEACHDKTVFRVALPIILLCN
jgi:hypothetical protein